MADDEEKAHAMAVANAKAVEEAERRALQAMPLATRQAIEAAAMEAALRFLGTDESRSGEWGRTIDRLFSTFDEYWKSPDRCDIALSHVLIDTGDGSTMSFCPEVGAARLAWAAGFDRALRASGKRPD